MKRISRLPLCLLASLGALLSSCKEGRTAGEGGGQEADTLWSESLGQGEGEDDEVDEVIEEVERSASPLLSFNDFFFLFLRNKRFQAAHVKFPLEVEELDASVHTITSGAAFRSYFLWPDEGEEYTLMLTDLSQMDALDESGALDSVVAQVIDLQAMTARDYCFHCADSLWQLLRIDNYEPRGRLGDFLRFYARFATDTLFQQDRLAEQISFSSPDPDDETQVIEGILLPSQWEAFRPDLPQGLITNLLFGQRFDSTQRILLLQCGAATGMMQTTTFEQVHGRWLLTSFDD